jgi:amino acid transporter
VTEPRRPIRGRKPGDRRIRVERPHAAYFRYSAEGQLVAKEAASAPRTPAGRALARARAILFGRPLSIHEEIAERLSKKKALAIFSSDPISSSAYATEEILRVLVLAGAGALLLSIPIAIAIALLIAIVSTSYRQEVYAYPSGGGDYAVARRNLPGMFALIVAGALLVDYVMTVAVSTANAVEQVISAVPGAVDFRVGIGVAAIILITLGNLRGLRESGNIFAIPTYLFVGSALLMIAIGLFRVIVNGEHVAPPDPVPGQPSPVQLVGVLLIIKAFASGSVALTGTEAIANGVPAFKPPEAKNAATTLTAVAVILAVLFIGITFVADSFGVVPLDNPPRTVISQVAAIAYGNGSIFFYLFQTFTALILFLAANTSYNAFPRLGAILARDGFMPRQFSFRGDRLAFTSGILILSAAAITLLVLFKGETTALVPLYSVGVFVAFTIGQTGMVLHWRREQPAGWRRRLAINAFGAVLTGFVFIVVLVAKLQGGSWLVAVIITVLVAMMLFIKSQYDASNRELQVRPDAVVPAPHRDERVIVPVPGITRAVVQAVNVGRSIAPDITAVLISDEPEEASAIRARWERQLPDVPLVIVESPFRALVAPMLAYLDVLDQTRPAGKDAPITFMVIPEYVARSWWERILYNQSAKRLRAALLGRPHTVVVNVPYRREDPDPAEDPDRES